MIAKEDVGKKSQAAPEKNAACEKKYFLKSSSLRYCVSRFKRKRPVTFSYPAIRPYFIRYEPWKPFPLETPISFARD